MPGRFVAGDQAAPSCSGLEERQEGRREGKSTESRNCVTANKMVP